MEKMVLIMVLVMVIGSLLWGLHEFRIMADWFRNDVGFMDDLEVCDEREC
jgi:hypothetical protein